ncbi:MAG TPA: PIN domain-containing protein [Roseovarius sp.]
MRKLFQSHLPENEEEVSAVWMDALIVFDANTILNLYRYSEKSRDELIDFLKKIKNRVWIPEQAAYEVFNNRLSVISGQASSYDAAMKSIADLRNSLRKDRAHPFISEETMETLSTVLQSVESELKNNQEREIGRLRSDQILLDIIEIFDERMGEPFSTEQLEEIFDHGVERYLNKVPPGYKDAKKHPNPETVFDKRRVYGDLMIWKQISKKSKDDDIPIIFVTDDKKEDWWLEHNGKKIGPRIDLLDEFREITGKKLYMYRPDQFLKHAKERLNSDVSTETIDEINHTEEFRDAKVSQRSIGALDAWLNSGVTKSTHHLNPKIFEDGFENNDSHNKLGEFLFGDRERSSSYEEFIHRDMIDAQIQLEEIEDELNDINKRLDSESIDEDLAHLLQVKAAKVKNRIERLRREINSGETKLELYNMLKSLKR